MLPDAMGMAWPTGLSTSVLSSSSLLAVAVTARQRSGCSACCSSKRRVGWVCNTESDVGRAWIHAHSTCREGCALGVVQCPWLCRCP